MAGYVMRSTVIVPKTVAELEGGQTVAKGSAVTLPESYGDHLVAEKLARRDDDAVANQAGRDRADMIGEIIEMLGVDEFTKGGKPDVEAINKALPEDADPVTAAERDSVWAAMEAAD